MCYYNAIKKKGIYTMHISKRLKELRIENNFEVITHTIIPCNDSGISLGQLAIANEKIN